jgi:hypothetical protein
MPFSESSTEKIEVLGDGVINCQCNILIYKNDAVFAASNVKSCYFPGQDLSDAPQMVQKAASAFWTPEIIADYKTKVVSVAS